MQAAVVEFRIPMTPRFGARVEAAARSRGMTVGAFVTMVVRDFLLDAAARVEPHQHCHCRDVNRGQLGRCCACGVWGRAYAVTSLGTTGIATKGE